ncbi:MAG: NADPH-dependent FMN reductase [Prevotella sp.]|jgi:chromate reductase
MKKNILFIVGSLRKESFNRVLAKTAEEIIGDRANVSYLDYSDVPFMNQDIEFPAPAAVTKLRETVAAADAIWVFTPEYNYSYPGHVKNIFDWLSRPLVAGDHQTPTAIKDKKITMSGAGGKGQTAKCREKLAELLTTIGANIMPAQQAGIALNKEAWTEGKMIMTEEQREALHNQVGAFLEFIS